MSTSSLRTASLPAIAFFGVLFLFFFQLLNDFVEPIWAFWVEEGSISFEIIVLLLVFSPVVLIFLRADPPAVLAFILAKVVLMSRVIEVLLDPRGSMFVSGLGVASFLLLFPLILWDLGRKQDKEAIAEMGIGLVLALVLSLLFRTLGSGTDITTVGWWQVIGWVLAILAGAASVHLAIVEEIKPDVPEPLFMPSVTKRRFRLIGLSIGLMSVLFLLAYAFTSPQLLSSWTGSHFLVILTVMMAVLTLWAWVLVMQQSILSRLTPAIILVWNVLFVVALALMVYIYHVAFPAAPPPSWLYHIPLFLTLVLFPIILLDLSLLADEVVASYPSVKGLGIGFSVASLFLLLMLFAHGFTTNGDLIPGLGLFFQDNYWLVHLIAGFILLLTMLLAYRRIDELPQLNLPPLYAQIMTASVAGVAAVAVLFALLVDLFN